MPSGARSKPIPFFVTGSVRAELEHEVWSATGRLVRVAMYPMTVGEQLGRPSRPFFDRIVDGEELGVPAECPDLRGYVELALHSGFPDAALRPHRRSKKGVAGELYRGSAHA